MQIAVDREARSALMILAVCAFTIMLASITFIARGGVQIVRSEIPTNLLIGGMAVR